MSTFSPLLVPITVEAIVVNDPVRLGTEAFLRTQMRYGLLAQYANAQPGLDGNDTNFTTPGYKFSDYYNGVYLKWRLPDFFTHGQQDSVTGEMAFPRVPNRWLIVRNGGPVEKRTSTAWILESDYQYPANTPPSAKTYSQMPSLYVAPDAANGNLPYGVFMGRNTPLGSWAESGVSLELKAIGPGNPAFAFYQPTNNNIFSFVDPLNAEGPQTLTYMVAGWFADSTADPLNKVTDSQSFMDLLKEARWSLPTVTPSTAWTSQTMLYGSLYGVSWQKDTQPSGGAPTGATSIAVGNTSMEALTALVQAQAEEAGANIDAPLLEAFQLGLINELDKPNGLSIIDQKILASHFQKYSGGYHWTIVDAPDTTDPVDQAELDKEMVWLAQLNTAQAAVETAATTLHSLQQQLYILWWKFSTYKKPKSTPIPGLETRDKLQAELNPAVAGTLAAQTADAKAAHQDLLKTVPHGITAEGLDKAIQKYAADHGLPDTRKLKRSAADTFTEANNPVVLLAGAGTSGLASKVEDPLVRLSDQLVTSIELTSTLSITTQTVPIPQPNLTGVTGAPWSTELIASLVNELFLLDPTNATMVHAGLPNVALQDIVHAMSAPVVNAGVAPDFALASWTQNPWRPLQLLWEVVYFPIEYGSPTAPNWTFSDGQYFWNGADSSVHNTMTFGGTIQLSPTASINMEARITQFLDDNPYLPDDERDAFEALLKFVKDRDNWDLLSQALNGFHSTLTLRDPGTYISPRITSKLLDPSLPGLIGRLGGFGPNLGNIPTTTPFSTQFKPWRAGQFHLLNLALVDEWGQALWIVNQNNYKNIHLFLPQDLSPVVASNPLPFTVSSDSQAPSPATQGETLQAISPSILLAGMAQTDDFPLKLTGENFTSDSVAQWNDTPLTTTFVSAAELSATVPSTLVSTPGTAEITVVTSGAPSNALPFTIAAGPTITSVSPATAAVGSAAFTLDVRGVGFLPVSTVYWGATALATTFVDSTHLQAQVTADKLTSAGTFQVSEATGHLVLPDAPQSLVQLPPALLQPARLRFDFLDGLDASSSVQPNALPGAELDPISGWVIPNHLDAALVAYTRDGVALGELSVAVAMDNQPHVCWTDAPFSPYAGLDAIRQSIPNFGPFLYELGRQTLDTFRAFLRAIDETLWTTHPADAAFDNHLAALVGRPLAMLRAHLQFQLNGAIAPDPSWQYTFAPPNPPVIAGYQFAVQLGDIANVEDGLIGYFQNGDYTRFNVSRQSGAKSSDYLRPIGTDNNYVFLPTDNTTGAVVSMLVDPRASVHARSAIVPDVQLTAPADFVASSLAAMDVTFRIDGLLTDQQITAATDTVPSATSVQMPLPKVPSGTWKWVQSDGSGPYTYPVLPNDTVAHLSASTPTLRRGMLQLSGAFKAKRSLARRGRVRSPENPS